MPTALKENTIIATRDFLRNFSKLYRRPTSRSYIIVSHGKPVMKAIPISPTETNDWWKQFEGRDPLPYEDKSLYTKGTKRITLEELREKYSFHSGEKHLSQRIDEIVYGIKR